jgi:hypothetical protein
MMRHTALGLLFSSSIFVAACASSSTPTTPTAGSAATTTETFSGSIGQSGNATYPFTVSSTGAVQVGLTSVAPLATMALGVEITTGGTSCGSAVAKNDNARSGGTALTGTAAAGSYCVEVYDSGNIPDSTTVTYTVQVGHP